MGFTGKDAAGWKERFIAAFNAMEAQIRAESKLAAIGIAQEVMDIIERTFGVSRMLARKVTEIARGLAQIERLLADEESRVDERARAMLAESAQLLLRGKRAKQIWDAAGLPRKIKGSTKWFGNRQAECGFLHEGRADRGDAAIRLFDPDKAETMLRNGMMHRAQQYADERLGQGRFKL